MNRNDPSQPVQAWPKGFKMLAGNPNGKTPNGIFTYYCHRKPDLTDELSADNFNFDDPCIGGLKFDLTFPSCWDGINLYKSDGSHMTYPTHGLRDGACPASHPIRLPSILLEYTYHPESFPAITQGQNLNGHLAWANGDTTGYGLHGDFIMGWDRDILTKALNDPGCVNLGYSITIQTCPTLAPYFNIDAGKNCKPARGQLTEPYAQGDGNIVPKLPGCNLLWGASGSKPTCNPPVAGLDVSAFKTTAGPDILPDSERYNATLPSAPGWNSIGCYNGALTGGISYTDNSMTPERCQDSCKRNGYSYAGLSIVGSFTCTCTNTFDNTAGIQLSGCDTACPSGNKTCGGQYRQDVYYQAPQYVTPDTSIYDLGCYKLPYDWASDNLVKSATYSFTSTGMTRDVCSQACIEKSAAYSAVRDTSCYCGPSLVTGPGFYVPGDMCTRKCGGNSTEICGDYYMLSVGNLANYQGKIVNNSPSNIGYRGCYQEGNGKLALQGYSFTSGSMTVPLCKSYCNQLGYSMAGLRNGNQCYCDSTFNGGSLLPDSQCSTPCAGNSTQFCGNAYTLSLYNSNATTYGAAEATAAHNTGWQGCYASTLVQTKQAYADYQYSSNDLTIDFCKSTCAYFGYSYSAVWAGYSCNCGNVLIQTNRLPDANCNTACRGNSSMLCGGPNSLDVYQADKSYTPDTTALVAKGWLGCYGNPQTGTPLSEYSYTDSKMTPQLCQTACKQVANYKYSALSGITCTCGNTNAGVLISPLVCKNTCAGDNTQTCGGSYAASVYNTTAGIGSSDTSKPAGWTGCYKEGSGYRALSSYTFSSNSMTSALCRKACAIRGYAIAANETCGAGSILDVYNTSGIVTAPDAKTGALGCFSDFSSLSGYRYTSSLMSGALCAQTCKGKGFALSATTAGNTCLCGDAASKTQVTLNPDSACSTACAGTTTGEKCGSGNQANLYDTAIAAANAASPSFSGQPGYMGCYNEGSARTLASYTYNSNTLTNKECITSCGNLGFKYAGTEYSIQCFCSNTIDTSSGGGILQADSDCSMKCSGNSTEMCGNSGRLSIYDTSKSGLVAAAPAIDGFVGCYAQGGVANAGNYLFQLSTMTAQLCRLACTYKGFSNAALAGNMCYCATGINQVGALQALALCSTPCAGNSTENCGNSQNSAVGFYNTAGATPAQANKPVGYLGCFNDNIGSRQLPGYTYTNTNMTNLNCAVTCAGKGFSLSGTQNGNACFCGSTLPYTLLQENYCASTCNGVSGEICGSANTLSVYNATVLAATAPKASNPTSAVTSANTASRSVSGSSTVSASSTVGSSTVPASSTVGSTSILASSSSAGASSSGVSASVTRTSASATATSSAADPFATYVYKGCIADGSTRVMNNTWTYSAQMTVEQCAKIGKAAGRKLFGMQNGGACFISDTLVTNTSATGCDQACLGDASGLTKCGGAWRLSLYEFIPLSQLPATTSSAPTSTQATSTSSSTVALSTSAAGSGTCAAVTVTQTASATVTVTVTGSASTSTGKVVKRRRRPAGESHQKYQFRKHTS
ncbi:hypothetical protein QFC19_001803 [Naganishia cerealis]|uniref:Uncharacterized protein n=1 Tax=Naganishia cerealis TaxID=610337 RepID=A0ACC2WHU8_9TREE|nr:hypothetical protein QFC19_001803 [Naganishia cerealis]